MTIAELALYFNKVFGLGANLTVIGMEGYKRNFKVVKMRITYVQIVSYKRIVKYY